MILAHPLVLNTAWQTQRPPESCKKEVPGHETAIVANDDEGEDLEGENGEEIIVSPFLHRIGTGSDLLLSVAQPESPRTGPCLFKLWELIPREAAQTVIDIADGEAGEQHACAEPLPLGFGENGQTLYQNRPDGEPARGRLTVNSPRLPPPAPRPLPPPLHLAHEP